MKSLYDIPAPAKLNLFLHITARRADGYHLLQSVFALIDWSDTLHFDLRTDGVITREDLTLRLPADDLITQAARALQQATGCTLGVHIGIEKRVPAQAGMGGGSSDAASTLLVLNRLWALNLPLDSLVAIGLKLGADVPFFLGGHNAWVEGIGECMTPIELPIAQYLVAKPEAGLDTRMIFCDPNLKRDSEPAIISGFAADAFGNAFNYGQNDLQAVAQKLCPGVTQALEWLALQGLNGRMTGSGSAVFAHVPAEKANSLLSNLSQPAPGLQVRACRGLGKHPLLGWAVSEGRILV
ncbi:MAG: 4-(cytidine 5'-diphospho)-2-C-methyl-D-erythritol kinase [Burkholderiales bacterium PBB3]|nr:MAG: 4-(cytidine 5'-diphospho)-2-C-methyl-D-erythritol kinase [Burkholderiales bacterium PBB3]